MAGTNCCNSITLPLILFTNLVSVIDKYQTGVMSATCYLPTDAISDCTCAQGVLSRRLACWLMDSVYSRRSFCGLFGTATVKEMFFRQ